MEQITLKSGEVLVPESKREYEALNLSEGDIVSRLRYYCPNLLLSDIITKIGNRYLNPVHRTDYHEDSKSETYYLELSQGEYKRLVNAIKVPTEERVGQCQEEWSI